VDGERGDGFQAFAAGSREWRAILPAHFGEKKFGVAENAGQRIIEFTAQEFGKAFVAREFSGGSRSAVAVGFVQPPPRRVQMSFDTGWQGCQKQESMRFILGILVEISGFEGYENRLCEILIARSLLLRRQEILRIKRKTFERSLRMLFDSTHCRNQARVKEGAQSLPELLRYLLGRTRQIRLDRIAPGITGSAMFGIQSRQG